ncbi:hypothetical protein C2S51_018992 [Perilla frutescens var. frutescens]|nr:hypothetical protein C2S51_018992 [Perilla frutescens var. frutescens]
MNTNDFDDDSSGKLGFKKPRIAARDTPWLRIPISVNRGKLSIPYKSELCIQHRKHRCYHGVNCHFAHNLSEIRQPGSKTLAMDEHVRARNAVCRGRECLYFSNGVDCPYGDRCNFLHECDHNVGGLNRVFDRSGLGRGRSLSGSRLYDHKLIYHKTKLCMRWEESFGCCPYGERCTYAHGRGELQEPGYYAELENGRASRWMPYSQPRNVGSCKMGFKTVKNLQMKGNVDFKEWDIAKMAQIYADWIGVGHDFHLSEVGS